MPKYDDPRSFVPDDWRRLPSGLYVKVWTAAELDPEERKTRGSALTAAIVFGLVPREAT